MENQDDSQTIHCDFDFLAEIISAQILRGNYFYLLPKEKQKDEPPDKESGNLASNKVAT